MERFGIDTMRYTSNHKQKTHERIVAEASRLFREEGYKGASVDAVMQAAELTPGGFYAHFEDKDALLAEVLDACILRKNRRLSADAEITADSFREWVEYYLSRDHLDEPGNSCPLTTLTAEVARQPKKVRKAFTQAMRTRLAEIARAAPGETDAERSENAIAALASLMGAVMLARAVSDPELSDQILRVVRNSISPRTEEPGERRQTVAVRKPLLTNPKH
jgi:TetR/AcrR family transcriptional regulator, transcriptional repressor for nem operon